MMPPKRFCSAFRHIFLIIIFCFLGGFESNCTKQRNSQAEDDKAKIFISGTNEVRSSSGPSNQKEGVQEEIENEPAMVEVLRARIGLGPDDIGVITPEEANPEGPMSFTVNTEGEIYVLDQVNSRIQVFKDGERLKTISIPDQVFMDIEWMPTRRIALLDNLIKKSVYILNEDGSVYEIISLTGAGVPDPAEITGIYCHSDKKWAGLWLELNDRSLRITDLGGNPQPLRTSLPGKLSVSGRRLMKVKIAGQRLAIIQVSQEDLRTWRRFRITFAMPFGYIHGIWDDDQGQIYLAVYLFDEETPAEANIAVKLSPRGKELGRIKMFISPMPHEIYHAVRVMPEGEIYQMAMEEGAVVIRRYVF